MADEGADTDDCAPPSTSASARSDRGETKPTSSIVFSVIVSAAELIARTAARVTIEMTSPRMPSDADKIFPASGGSDSCDGRRNGTD